jgi:hypothetical protein
MAPIFLPFRTLGPTGTLPNRVQSKSTDLMDLRSLIEGAIVRQFLQISPSREAAIPRPCPYGAFQFAVGLESGERPM